MLRFVLVSALLLGGCAATRQYFQPTERVHGITEQGFRESMYDLTGAKGRFGEAKIWSRGAYRGPGDRTVIHLGLELHNTGGTPIVVRPGDVVLDRVRTGEGLLTEVAPAEHATYQVAPAGILELRFHFVLPAGIAPDDVSAFRARWGMTSADQSYVQHTPFVEQRAAYYYGPPYAYYRYYCDPFDPYCFYPGPYYSPYPYPAYRHVIIVHPERPGRSVVRGRR